MYNFFCFLNQFDFMCFNYIFYLIVSGHMCRICKLWFSTSSTLLKHRLWHHKNEFPSFKFNCSLCPYASDVATSFKRHKSVHDSERPYFCTVCGNRFIAMSSLSHHMIIHTGEQNFTFHSPVLYTDRKK